MRSLGVYRCFYVCDCLWTFVRQDSVSVSSDSNIIFGSDPDATIPSVLRDVIGVVTEFMLECDRPYNTPMPSVLCDVIGVVKSSC
jgi:hypothetical protein